MKPITFAILAAAAIAFVATPVAAQLTGGDHGADFVDAVKKSDGDKANQLLSENPKGIINARDDDGNTALLIAVQRGDDAYTAFLLNKGADPNLPGKGGDTPLIVAARMGYQQGVEWLIGMGAKVDAANRMGETPLITAVQQRQTAIARMLLAAGADPDKTDTAQGFSARQYAERDPHARDILNLINGRKSAAAVR